MIPVNYLVFKDILNLLAFWGGVAGVCFVFACVARLAVLFDRRYTRPPPQKIVEIHHYVSDLPQYPMLDRGDDNGDEDS